MPISPRLAQACACRATIVRHDHLVRHRHPSSFCRYFLAPRSRRRNRTACFTPSGARVSTHGAPARPPLNAAVTTGAPYSRHVYSARTAEGLEHNACLHPRLALARLPRRFASSRPVIAPCCRLRRPPHPRPPRRDGRRPSRADRDATPPWPSSPNAHAHIKPRCSGATSARSCSSLLAPRSRRPG